MANFSKIKKYAKKYVKRKASRVYAKFRQNPMGVAMQALAGVKALRGIVNSERHVTDIAPAYSGYVSTSTTGQTISLIKTAIGDTNSTRTGNSILMKTLQVKGYLTFDTTAKDARVHFILVQDKQQISDSVPNWSDFYTGDINSFPANFSHQRFKVLGHYKYRQTDNNKDTQVPVNIFCRYTTHIKYNGPLESDIAKNGIYLIMISNRTSYTPTLAVNTRLTYYDN